VPRKISVKIGGHRLRGVLPIPRKVRKGADKTLKLLADTKNTRK
jgi:hypothetical protein